MIYFKQFVFFVVFYLFNFNIGFAQFTKLPDYNWNKFNIVKLDTIEVSDEFKELPIFILYNYHKESFASPDKSSPSIPAVFSVATLLMVATSSISTEISSNKAKKEDAI
ncbi:MAG: hypothetical protein ACI8UQ_001443 [Bacteroidia bacterium]|jgi:hypothetical protein